MKTSAFCFVFLFLAELNAQWEAREVYACLDPVGRLETSALVGLQKLKADRAGIFRLPQLSVSESYEEHLLNRDVNPAELVTSVRLSQNIYSKELKNRYHFEMLTTEIRKNTGLQSRARAVQEQLGLILDYYRLKDQIRIVQSKILRKTELLKLLNDLVASKSADGAFLKITQADLQILEIRKKEMELDLLARESKFLYTDDFKKMIVNDSVLNWAQKYFERKPYREISSQLPFKEIELRKSLLQFEKSSLLNTLKPSLDFNLEYNYWANKERSAGFADTFIVGAVLTFSLDEMYVSKSKSEYVQKELSFQNGKASYTEKLNTAEQRYFKSRLDIIEASIKKLSEVKKLIADAKAVVENKLILGKASYADYLQLDDKIDDLETEVFNKSAERLALFFSNDLVENFSEESLQLSECTIKE